GYEGIQGFIEQMIQGSPIESLPEAERTRFRWELQSWMVSQFMHGEQGALVATSRLVETVPSIDAKYYAAVQVMDEARHVEAYAKYLNEKLHHSYPITGALQSLLEDIVTETRWDITYLGMQIMVEGLALAAFGLANFMVQDPIVKQITDLVMRDEARHVAFGVLSLQGIYEDMSGPELAEREEFVMEASTLMRDRFLLEDVWERMGVDVAAGRHFANVAAPMIAFRQMLFSKIVPNLNKLGLLTDRVRCHFEELGVIQHEHNLDSATELDPSLVA
ncbi:MAG: ferritin-like domain-containing protein, partial [Acidimicrobiia bacterium]|nr:ferritin-like domain-containing protein [Acidimicrobiia bacterium]